MANKTFSTKRLQIDKANANVVVAVSVASMIVVFSLVAAYSLNTKRAYQGKVIGVKEIAVQQLKDNIKAVDSLGNSYKNFISTSENVLGGNPKGTGDKDGDNAKIVLDALPSKYDFPALAASLEKILIERNYQVQSITGTDEEVAQQNPTEGSPKPIEIPFEITVKGNYKSISELVKTLEASIRSFKIETIELSGSDNNLTAVITGKTYYQPGKSLNIQYKEVK